MATRKSVGTKPARAQPRASITFHPELYKTLEDLAREKKVLIAWVVRDAVEQYIATKTPLFNTREST